MEATESVSAPSAFPPFFGEHPLTHAARSDNMTINRLLAGFRDALYPWIFIISTVFKNFCYSEIEHRIMPLESLYRIKIHGTPLGRLHTELRKMPLGITHRRG